MPFMRLKHTYIYVHICLSIYMYLKKMYILISLLICLLACVLVNTLSVVDEKRKKNAK